MYAIRIIITNQLINYEKNTIRFDADGHLPPLFFPEGFNQELHWTPYRAINLRFSLID